MDAIVYGDLRIEMIAEHGGKILRTAQRVIPDNQAGLRQPRPDEPRRHEAPATLLGRDAETAAAFAATVGEPVEFHAACGFGKSTLLQHVASQKRSRAGTPVAYLRVGGYRAGDLRQRLVEALYPADMDFKPTPEQRGQLLRQARATILLDDVTLDSGELAELLDDVPQCTILIGCNRPILEGRGRSVPLTGLPADAALDLLRGDLGRDLIGGERADAEWLCRVVEGRPLYLRQAAALVREGRQSFADLARAAEHDAFALDRQSVNALTGPQRRALAMLAFAAGALLPAELIGNVTGAADTWRLLASLRTRGLAEQDNDQFGLPICHADDYRALLERSLELGDAVRVLVNWVRQRGPGSHDAQDAADAALSIIGYAAERAEWPAVTRLVEAIEPVLSLSGRWDAWINVLGRGLSAARMAGDLSAQAHMLHQLGVHEFAVGNPEQAREYWKKALDLREKTNGVAGAEVTRANMGLLPPAAPPTHRPPRRRSRRQVFSKSVSTWAAVAGTALVAVALPLAHTLSSRSSAEHGPAVTSSSPTSTTHPRDSGGSYASSSPAASPSVTTSIVSTTHARAARASAILSVSPRSYNGFDCPAVFTFNGVIHVSSGPTTVTYQWIRSDGRNSYPRRIHFTGSGPQYRVVSTTWTLSTDGTSWEAIKIVSPGSAESRAARFTLTCQTATATVSAPPTSNIPSKCPVALTFTGDIHVSDGPVTVKYQWISSDGVTSSALPTQTVEFTGSGPQDQTLSITRRVSASGTYGEAIQFISPGSARSSTATVTVACQTVVG